MNLKKPKLSNIIFLVVVVLLIIPQTRQPIQVFLHKGMALFSPSVISTDDRKTLNDYHWKLQSLEGIDYNFSEAKGKVVLINFWATWCPPCIAEMPALQSLYNDYQDKVEIVLVSDEKPEVIRKFLDKHNYSFKVYQSQSEIPKDLQTRSIPRTFLIDKKGTIVIDKSGAANWNSDAVKQTIDSLLK